MLSCKTKKLSEAMCVCIGSKIYVTPFVSNSVNWLSKLFGVDPCHSVILAKNVRNINLMSVCGDRIRKILALSHGVKIKLQLLTI